MQIGGWLRLWVVVVVLYGLVVGVVGYKTRPTLDDLNYRWIGGASDVIAQVISRAENRDIQSYKVKETFFSKLTDAEAIEQLKTIATSPSENQRLFSSEVGKVNQKYVELIGHFGTERLVHILLSLAWWLGPSLAVLAFGFATGWVIRGFRGKNV